jgi:MFS family permease
MMHDIPDIATKANWGIVLGCFSGYVADDPSLGWRWAFGVCGLAGVIYALPLFAVLRHPWDRLPACQPAASSTGCKPVLSWAAVGANGTCR